MSSTNGPKPQPSRQGKKRAMFDRLTMKEEQEEKMSGNKQTQAAAEKQKILGQLDMNTLYNYDLAAKATNPNNKAYRDYFSKPLKIGEMSTPYVGLSAYTNQAIRKQQSESPASFNDVSSAYSKQLMYDAEKEAFNQWNQQNLNSEKMKFAVAGMPTSLTDYQINQLRAGLEAQKSALEDEQHDLSFSITVDGRTDLYSDWEAKNKELDAKNAQIADLNQYQYDRDQQKKLAVLLKAQSASDFQQTTNAAKGMTFEWAPELAQGVKNILAPGEAPKKDSGPYDQYSDIKTFALYLANPEYKNYMDKTHSAVQNSNRDMDLVMQMTPQEQNTLLYYAGKGDWASAQEYFGAIKQNLGTRFLRVRNTIEQDWADEHKVGAVVSNILVSPFQALGVAATGISALIDPDKPVDLSNPVYDAQRAVSNTTAGITKGMKPWQAFLTQTGLSVGQMLTALPFGEAASLAILSTEAAGQTSYQALQSGASAGQAFALGVSSGLMEFVTEKIPLHNLFELAKTPAKFTEQLLQIAKQSGLEGAQESISEYGKNIADQIIMGDKSQYSQLVAYLRTEKGGGYSRDEAERKAFNQLYLKNPGIAFLGGTIAGGFMGTGAAGISTLNSYNSAVPNITRDTPVVTGVRQTADTPSAPDLAAYIETTDKSANTQHPQDVVIDKATVDAAGERLGAYEDMASFTGSPESIKAVLKAQLEESYSAPRQAEIAAASYEGAPYTVEIGNAPVKSFVENNDITPDTLSILDHLDTVVRNGSYVGSGEMAAKTIEGQGITIPYDTFRSIVDAGGDRYVVEFTVTESPSGGNAVHSVEIVKAPETQLRALYDQYIRAGAGNQSVETGGTKGYNGNGNESTGNGAGDVETGGLDKQIIELWYEDGTAEDTATTSTGKSIVDNPFDDAGNLQANIIYQSGEFKYNYETDSLGRLEKFQTDDLSLTERTYRLSHNSNTPGKLQGDHAGHLAGDRFGGSPNLDNLVSQSSDINLRQYRKIEDQWAKAIKEGRKVQVRVEVIYDGDNKRPAGFNITYKIDEKLYLKFLKN